MIVVIYRVESSQLSSSSRSERSSPELARAPAHSASETGGLLHSHPWFYHVAQVISHCAAAILLPPAGPRSEFRTAGSSPEFTPHRFPSQAVLHSGKHTARQPQSCAELTTLITRSPPLLRLLFLLLSRARQPSGGRTPTRSPTPSLSAGSQPPQSLATLFCRVNSARPQRCCSSQGSAISCVPVPHQFRPGQELGRRSTRRGTRIEPGV